MITKYKYLIGAVIFLLCLWRAWDMGYNDAALKYETEKKEAVEKALATADERFAVAQKNQVVREKIVYRYRDRVKEVAKHVETTPNSTCVVDDDSLWLFQSAVGNTDNDTSAVPADPDNG